MFHPFRGLLFDPDRLPDVGSVTSPPYDVIDDDERLALSAASPFNIVRVLLCDPDDATYQRAAATFAGWRDDRMLVHDPGERYYLYTMDYTATDGRARTARGVLGALDLLPLGERVLPHEETMDKHRADRAAVLAATETNLDVIIALSASPDLGPLLEPQGGPRLDFEADGVRHRLYDITDPDAVAAITAAVAGHSVSIADGHHRYTTALAYRSELDATRGPGPWDSILALMAPAEGSGLTVGPYHRTFERLAFDPALVDTGFEVAEGAPSVPDHPGDLVVVTSGGAWHLRPRDEALAPLPEPWRLASPAVARELLYPLLGITEDEASYAAEAAAALSTLVDHPDGGVLLVAPVSEHAIAAASEKGIRFPQKTTYFVPKPRAGLVLRTFDA